MNWIELCSCSAANSGNQGSTSEWPDVYCNDLQLVQDCKSSIKSFIKQHFFLFPGYTEVAVYTAKEVTFWSSSSVPEVGALSNNCLAEPPTWRTGSLNVYNTFASLHQLSVLGSDNVTCLLLRTGQCSLQGVILAVVWNWYAVSKPFRDFSRTIWWILIWTTYCRWYYSDGMLEL